MGKNIVVKLPGREALSLTAGAFCSPCEAEKLTQQTIAVQKAYQNNTTLAVAPPENAPADLSHEIRWEGPLGFEGDFTGDGRYIVKNALRMPEMPCPLRWAPTDVGAHGGAVVVGLIETMQVNKNGEVWGTGFIDSSTEWGAKAVQGLQSGLLKGVSMDLDEMSFEVRVKQEIIDEVNAMINEMMDSEDTADTADAPIDVANGEQPDENGYTKVDEHTAMDEVMYVTDALVRAATIVDIPAFKNAYVALTQDDEPVRAAAAVVALVAGLAPLAPSSDWFADPQLDGPTPITITADGRIYGHAALWGTCHQSFQDRCIMAPRSLTNYAWFRTGAVQTAEGTEVPVGRVTIDTGHAGLRASAPAAAAHYDNTGTAVADVAAGEDKHGLWVSGALRPDITEEQLRVLRSSPLSGDWRTVGGNLELVAMLAVNVPGFPVPRTKALVASGRTGTLIRPAEGQTVVEEKMEEPKAPSAVEVFAATARKIRTAQWAQKVGE